MHNEQFVAILELPRVREGAGVDLGAKKYANSSINKGYRGVKIKF